MTDRRRHRLSLQIAIGGTLLIGATIYADLWLPPVDYNLPRFETSKPSLADWPEHPVRDPRA